MLVWQGPWVGSEFLKAGLSNGLAHPFLLPSEGLTEMVNYETWPRPANQMCLPNDVRNNGSCSRGVPVPVSSLTALFKHQIATWPRHHENHKYARATQSFLPEVTMGMGWVMICLGSRMWGKGHVWKKGSENSCDFPESLCCTCSAQ